MKKCANCGHPEKDHANRSRAERFQNRYCEQFLCCCTRFVELLTSKK
jgi:hypothetical protein